MSVRSVKLNDGHSIPVIGFGAGTAYYQRDSLEGIAGALKAGYKSLDCAQEYKNSEYVGKAIKEWGGKREELYILTKFGLPGGSKEETEPRTALMVELKKLGVDYVDMYLIHKPGSLSGRSYKEVWGTMEGLKKEGLTKSIGVSNFMTEHLEELEKVWTIPPAVNQIRYHPYLFHTPETHATKALCDKHDIHLQAYGPLTPLKNPGGSVDQVIQEIASRKGATPAQVLLAWGAQNGGGTVVTTSRDTKRRAEMLAAFTKISPLTDAEVKEISDAGKKQ